MKKYIHYCWFGDKPLPKLAKKCIESWKKFLPEYEIIKWSEENVNLDECPFIRGAYDQKAWAFVADYARTKALKEMGGIYFDTDMEITKPINSIIDKGSFLGVEDTGKIACGVWYETKSNSYLSCELLKKYKSYKKFDKSKANEYAIPLLITDILEKCGFKYNEIGIQKLTNDMYIYPREYFYPYSYNWENNIFTENTCMIHYYDASWIPLKDKIEINMVRKFGRSNTFKILNYYRKAKDIIRKIAKVVLFPIMIYKNIKRKKALITEQYINGINNTIMMINKYKNCKYIAIHNGAWFGVTSATKELFENTVDCREIYRKEDIIKIGNAIISNNIKQVIFSSFSIGDKELATYLKRKNKGIKIKSYWHGSHSQVLDEYGWKRNVEIIKLHRKKIIDVMGTCKESIVNFYNSQGFKSAFITNKVEVLPTTKTSNKKQKEKIRIGLYAAKCDDWRKNMYSQMAAVSLIPNAVIDMVPLNENAKKFAEILGVELEGVEKSLSREELLDRMTNNSLNLYVTYSECAPILPLESFEKNVLCITGNNHHYFKDSELEKYLVVNNEESPIDIKNKIVNCLKNEDKIKKMYEKFRDDNIKKSKLDVDRFIKM